MLCVKSIVLYTDDSPMMHEADDASNELPACSYSRDDIKQKLASIVERVMTFCDSDPMEFSKAVDAAYRNIHSVKTTSSVISALCNFCKKSGIVALSAHRNNQTASPVQPTAIARRKSQVGSQHCVISSRPPKRSFPADHSYDQPSKSYVR